MAEMISTPQTQDLSPALMRLSQSVLLSDEEIAFFDGIQNNVIAYKRGEAILAQGEDMKYTMSVLDGWVMSYRITSAGRRQIVALYLPGDFIGLHINFVKTSIVNLTALSNVSVSMIEPLRIVEVHQRFPILASGLDWSASRTTNILIEHNISLGARTAEEKILHFYLELWCRLMLVAEAGSEGFEMRMTQEQTGDVLGLSTVHINKTLKVLVDKGLLAIENRTVSFPDIREAIRMADFDTAFLDTFRTAALATSGMSAGGRVDELIEATEELKALSARG